MTTSEVHSGQTSIPVPVEIKVTRYVCPFCSRGRSRRSATEEHIGRCWWNPGNKTCKTCAHHVEGHHACGCDDAGCNWGGSEMVQPSCEAGVRFDGIDDMPRVGCSLWTEESR